MIAEQRCSNGTLLGLAESLWGEGAVDLGGGWRRGFDVSAKRLPYLTAGDLESGIKYVSVVALFLWELQ